MSTPQPYLVLSAILFAIGAATVIVRRQPVIVLLGVELMLQAANLAFGALTSRFQEWEGHITVWVAVTVAAIELAVGVCVLLAQAHAQARPLQPTRERNKDVSLF